MSRKPYPKMKPSGVDWLGDMPCHWTVVSLKRDLEFLTSGSRGWAGHYTDEGAIFIRIGNLTRDGVRLNLSDIQRVTVPPGTEGERTRVQSGDLLFSITAYLGSVAVAPHNLDEAYVSQHVALARLQQKKLLPSWVAYVALSYVGKTYLQTQGYGGTKVQLSLDDIAGMVITVPSIDEQRAIAAFLDRETAKIDALVAEQERLIALLAEKRRAVISHAVTKGLDPKAPMKDSGIGWLGEVPAHWEVSQMRRVVSKIEQGWSPLAEGRAAEASECGVLKLSAVSRGLFWQEENKAFGGELDGDKALEVRGDDFLITRANTPSLVGECCVVPQDVRGSLFLPDLIYRLSLSPTMDARFLCELLRSAIGRHQIQRDARGSSMSMAKIAQEHIKSWVLLKPPLREQSVIVAHLDRHNGKLDTLITEAERAITLLKERRAALISAAVTGKIDVRDAVDTEEVAA